MSENGDPVVTTGLCPSCDQWLVNLAVDGRSARGWAYRQSEGEYGSLLHPNLEHVLADFAIRNKDAEDSLRAWCEQLGVTVAPAAVETTVSVLFVEASSDGAAREALLDTLPGTKTVILARVGAATELREAIRAGASDWVTLPFTPQQLVGALQRVSVDPAEPVRWDLGTCLPQASYLETTRPAIMAVPGEGVDPLLVAWSLRRFTRGYDRLVMVEGDLLLLPLARPEYVGNIIDRLTAVMGKRVALLPYEAPRFKRFEASA